jgi:beta-galactosidase
VIAGTETFPSHAFDTWRATEALPQVIGDFVWTSIDYLGESGIGKVTYEEGSGFRTPYPYHLANCGDIDICGFKRPQSYYRDLLWGVRSRPWIGVHDPAHHETPAHYNSWGWKPVEASWTFPGQEGNPTRVDVYAVDDEVELWINGRLAGRQPAGDVVRNTAIFEVTYEPGTIEAIGYTDGVETGRESLATAGEPVALRLTSDRAGLNNEEADLAYVTVEIVDADGNRVPWGRDTVTVSVNGAGTLAALGTADPLSEELYTGPSRAAYQGRLMAVVRANDLSGEITVEATARGLADARLEIEAWPATPV